MQGKGFEVEAVGVEPHFFDMNEDNPSVPRQWCLEVGDIETDVSDNFAFDQPARRVGPLHQGSVTLSNGDLKILPASREA